MAEGVERDFSYGDVAVERRVALAGTRKSRKARMHFQFVVGFEMFNMSAVFAGDNEYQFVHFSLAFLRRVTRSAHFQGCKVVVFLMRQLLSLTNLFYLH